MALELKKRSKQYLDKISPAIDIPFNRGRDIFGINELPQFLGEGKNSFRIKPRGIIQIKGEVRIEVLDRNRNPIYHEVPNYKDSDNSRLISIWVYILPSNKNYNTPDGPATITITGTTISNETLRWTYSLDVIKSKQSPSNIVFLTPPSSTISSSVETFTNKVVDNNSLVLTEQLNEVVYKKSVYGDTTSLEYEAYNYFNKEMVGGKVYTQGVNTTLYPVLGGGQSQPTQFTASITEVISPTILRIDSPWTASDNRSEGSIHTYEYSDAPLEVNIKYYSTGSDTTTQNQIAFANVSVSNLDPIVGRVYSVRTSIKSDGLSNSEYSVIGENKVENSSSISYKVPIPTEQLNDPKTLRLQFVNELGNVSTTELITSGLVFTGGNAYIAGDQSLITGSFHIGNTIGTGIEMAGHSSGYLKSVGYNGMTAAANGSGPGGFMIWSGSGNLQLGSDQYPGVGMEMVSQGGSSSFYFTTHDGGNLKVITDEFFIGTDDTQFISGSNGNIEISSSFFHLNPKDNEAIIGGFVVTPTAISSSENITGIGSPLVFKSNGQISGSSVLIRQRISTTNYTLIDTDEGIIDGRNVGRQVVSDLTEYSVTYPTSSTSWYTVAEYLFQVLPFETQFGLGYRFKAVKGGATSNSHGIRFLIASSSLGGTNSNNTNFYDDAFSSTHQILAYTPGTNSSYSSWSRSWTPDIGNSYNFSIPEEFTGKLVKLIVQLKLNTTAGTANNSTGTYVKNISLLTSRAYAASFSGQAERVTPSAPST